MSNHKCLVCNGNGTKLRDFAFFEATQEKLYLLRCDQCHLEFLDPQPSNTWLGEEYRDYYKRRVGNLKRPKTSYFKKLLSQTHVDFSDKSVVEIGPGEGDCLVALRSKWKNTRLFAVEANSESKGFFKELQCEQYCESIESWLAAGHKEKFDYVLMFDLIEHLRDPKQTLKTIVSQYLKPGGQIIATFPNVDSASRKLEGRLWPQYKVEHLFYFSRLAVERIERHTGLNRVKLSPLRKSLPLQYLLNVGTHFGPTPTRKAISLLASTLPAKMGRLSLPLYLGEYIWIAEKPA